MTQVQQMQAQSAEQMEALRIKYLSKKGEITELFNQFREVPKEEKKELGMQLNALRQMAESRLQEMREALEAQRAAEDKPDLTRTPEPIALGTRHPLSLTKEEIVDIFSRDIVGWEVWPEESADHASELIKRACLAQKRLTTAPLVLHSDNGSPMKGATMLETLYALGITPSNSRPRVSNDNPYSESLFKTLKYRPNYQPKGFEDIETARRWCSGFVNWYRHEHHHSGIRFLTPAERHEGKGAAILEKRSLLYQAAKAAHPERWNSRATRNWNDITEVYLNPDRSYTITTFEDPFLSGVKAS